MKDTMTDQHAQPDLVASQAAEIQRLRAELAMARKLLNPVCVEETLCGAIRNLQQAHLSEKGNAESAEAALSALKAEAGRIAGELRDAARDIQASPYRGPVDSLHRCAQSAWLNAQADALSALTDGEKEQK